MRSDIGPKARQPLDVPPNPACGMILDMSQALETVDRLITAIETGDIEGVKSCYAPEVVVWANFDNKAKDLDASLRVLSWVISATSDRRYEVLRRIDIEGGVLQQHVLHGTVAETGKTFSMPACLVITVRGDRITHIDEYLDASVMTPAFES